MLDLEKMRETEEKIEEVSKKVESASNDKSIPVYEVFIMIYSLLTAIFILNFPSEMMHRVLLIDGYIVEVFGFLHFMPDYYYGALFLFAGTLKGVGLIISSSFFRVSGLLLSSIIYLTFTIALIATAPSFLFFMFGCASAFCLISLIFVSRTSIKISKSDRMIAQQAREKRHSS